MTHDSSPRPAAPAPTDPGRPLKGADFICAGRGISRPVDVVNVPVVRASTVLFDSVEAAFAEGPPATVGEPHPAT